MDSHNYFLESPKWAWKIFCKENDIENFGVSDATKREDDDYVRLYFSCTSSKLQKFKKVFSDHATFYRDLESLVARNLNGEANYHEFSRIEIILMDNKKIILDHGYCIIPGEPIRDNFTLLKCHTGGLFKIWFESEIGDVVFESNMVVRSILGLV